MFSVLKKLGIVLIVATITFGLPWHVIKDFFSERMKAMEEMPKVASKPMSPLLPPAASSLSTTSTPGTTMAVPRPYMESRPSLPPTSPIPTMPSTPTPESTKPTLAPAILRVENSTSGSGWSGEPIGVYWVNPEGKEILYKELRPGESYAQKTFFTYRWRVRGINSGRLAKEVIITKPNGIIYASLPPIPQSTPPPAYTQPQPSTGYSRNVVPQQPQPQPQPRYSPGGRGFQEDVQVPAQQPQSQPRYSPGGRGFQESVR